MTASMKRLILAGVTALGLGGFGLVSPLSQPGPARAMVAPLYLYPCPLTHSCPPYRCFPWPGRLEPAYLYPCPVQKF